MDTLLTTVVAGVIVALVSAFAAYYFGMRQERQKQAYETQREGQKLQEETQKQLNERRSAILDEVRERAHATLEHFRDATFMYYAFQADLETINEISSNPQLRYDGPLSVGVNQSLDQAFDKKDKEGEALSTLRAYYEQQQPYLEPSTRKICRDFVEELSTRIGDTMQALMDLDSQARAEEGLSVEEFKPETFKEALRNVTIHLESNFQWATESHPLDALDAEAERLASKPW